MAVPKKKRYQQVVKSRRTRQIENNIKKKNIFLTKFENYTVTSEEYRNISYCSFFSNKEIKKKLCKFCYNPVLEKKVLRPKKKQEFEE
jgi:hypothetical protein